MKPSPTPSIRTPVRTSIRPACRSAGLAAAAVLALGLTACDSKPSAEQVGRDIDRAADQAGQKVAQAADRVEQKTDQAKSTITENAEKAGAVLADAAITTRVKAALIAEPGLPATGIDVATEKGVVSLYGTIPSDAGRARATQIAAAVDGVKGVENRLAVVQGS